MIAIVCVDDRLGTQFNRRRQSQDRAVRARMLEDAGGRPLWMNAYSAGQFAPEEQACIRVAEDFWDRAGAGELCFAEDGCVRARLPRVEALILYRWNRLYPADRHLDADPARLGWRLAAREDFPGFSHKLITKEVYRP